ncbi:MAG TPA: hypothetical protein VK927_11200 [Adhaeribacter sp.]|nr:hypothetical protein [Adhaeribacter sp.]
MKKVILILATGFFLSTSGFAALDDKNAKDNRALQATRQLSSQLQFNERTFILVKDLNVSKYQEIDKAASMFANDAKMKEAKIREIENRYNEQISALLSPTQKANFANYLQSNVKTSNMATAE